MEYEKLQFCNEPLAAFTQNPWTNAFTVQPTPDCPEKASFLYKFKKTIWDEKSTPSYLVTHYKINVEDDYIESYIHFYVREEDAHQASSDLLKFKSMHE